MATDVEEVKRDTRELLRHYEPQEGAGEAEDFDYITDELLSESEAAEEVEEAELEVPEGTPEGWTVIGRGHRVMVWKSLQLVRWQTDYAGSICGNVLWRQRSTGGRSVWTLNARRCPSGDLGGIIALG